MYEILVPPAFFGFGPPSNGFNSRKGGMKNKVNMLWIA
jgi:hypothetical protein